MRWSVVRTNSGLASSPHLFHECSFKKGVPTFRCLSSFVGVNSYICMDHNTLQKEKPRVLDINTAWIAARRIVFGVPLSQREQDIELAELFTPKEDPPPIISSISSGEDLQAKEEGPSSEERNSGALTRV